MPVIRFFHPAYGLADQTRYDCVVMSYTTTVREAAEHYNVSTSVVYNWRRAMRHNLTTLPPSERNAILLDLRDAGVPIHQVFGG